MPMPRRDSSGRGSAKESESECNIPAASIRSASSSSSASSTTASTTTNAKKKKSALLKRQSLLAASPPASTVSQSRFSARRGAIKDLSKSPELLKHQNNSGLVEELRAIPLPELVHLKPFLLRRRQSTAPPDNGLISPGSALRPPYPAIIAAPSMTRTMPLGPTFKEAKDGLKLKLPYPLPKRFAGFFGSTLLDELMGHVRNYITAFVSYNKLKKARGNRVGLEGFKQIYSDQLAARNSLTVLERNQQHAPDMLETLFQVMEDRRRDVALHYCRVLQQYGANMSLVGERKFYEYFYVALDSYARMLVEPRDTNAVHKELERLFSTVLGTAGGNQNNFHFTSSTPNVELVSCMAQSSSAALQNRSCSVKKGSLSPAKSTTSHLGKNADFSDTRNGAGEPSTSGSAAQSFRPRKNSVVLDLQPLVRRRQTMGEFIEDAKIRKKQEEQRRLERFANRLKTASLVNLSAKGARFSLKHALTSRSPLVSHLMPPKEALRDQFLARVREGTRPRDDEFRHALKEPVSTATSTGVYSDCFHETIQRFHVPEQSSE